MTPATAHFASTAAIAAVLQAQLQALKLANSAALAFQRVEVFDSENLVAAFNTLLISEQTVAIVVPLTAHWESEPKQRLLRSRRVAPVTVLISDRVIGNRTHALYGSATNQGAFNLAALALPVLTGQIISNPAGVISMPVSESVLIIKKDDRSDMPGRACVAVELDCRGGWMEVQLDPGPTL